MCVYGCRQENKAKLYLVPAKRIGRQRRSRCSDDMKSSSTTVSMDLPSSCWRSARVSAASDGSLATTGHKVWPGAHRLAEFLLESERGAEFLLESERVLELGAGTGWLGLTLALNVPRIHQLVLTEREDGMQFLASNVSAFESDTGVRCASVRALDWERGCEEDDGIIGVDWNLVIGSDLLYEEEGVRALIRVWKQLLLARSRAPTILYCHTLRRFDTIDEQLFLELEKEGLAVEEIADGNSERVMEDESPAYSELFPDMRQAVLLISLRKENCVSCGDDVPQTVCQRFGSISPSFLMAEVLCQAIDAVFENCMQSFQSTAP